MPRLNHLFGTSKNERGIAEIVIILIFAAVIFVVVVFTLANDRSQLDVNLPSQSPEIMTFTVSVPANTPTEDTVFLQISDIHPGQQELPMERVTRNTFRIELPKQTLQQVYDFPNITYRYNRNGWGFTTSEYLSDDIRKVPNIPANEEHGSNYVFRIAEYEDGKMQQDEVERWKWFPKGEIIKEDISHLGPTGEFLPRINGEEFRVGQGIEDLYVPSHDALFNSVATRLREKGFKWVVLYPPWQWVQEDPLPKVGNDIENNPNYPNDEKLIEHIAAFKTQGLKVYIEPQLCCTEIDTNNRSAEWWDTFINEVEKFLVYHAQIAQTAGVDALLFETYNIDQELPTFSVRMGLMFDKVKAHFDGEIATKVVPYLPEGIEVATEFLPDLDRMVWANRVDFFIYDAEGQLSAKDNPTDEELVAGAGTILDNVKEVYDRFKKPVVVRSTYFSVKGVWKGTSFLQQGKIPAHETSENFWEFHKYSGLDQARVDNAFFKAISSRPWIIGFVHFGYTHWDMPLLPDWGIRAREAEDLWEKWNRVL